MYFDIAPNILHSGSTKALKEHESLCTNVFTLMHVMA